MSTEIERLREATAKISAQMAQQMDSVYGTVANPEVIAVGMMRDLGATDLGAGEGKTRTVFNGPTEDSPELIEALKSGSLERVFRAKRKQASTREEKATSPGESRRPLKEIYDFSQYDDDEFGGIKRDTLTPDSAEAYDQELDQRIAGAGSYAEAQAWQVEAGEEEAAEADYESFFQQADWEREES